MSDEVFSDMLVAVCGPLEATGARYAITGSIASSIHGEPFDSRDVDICMYMTELGARRLHTLLPPRFYRDPDTLAAAARNHAMANLIDAVTGWKIDLCVLSDTPFYQSVLDRRIQMPFGVAGNLLWVVTPEDIILMKLEWRRDSRSVKQWDNALSVVRLQGVRLDFQYLRLWAGRLGLMADLEALFVQGGI